MAALLGTLVLAAGGYWYFHTWNNRHLAVADPDGELVLLAKGEAFSAFAERLHERGLLSHPKLWSRTAQLRGLAKQVQAGEYRVVASDTPEILLNRLISGDVVYYTVALIEGWTVMQAVAALRDNADLRRELPAVTADTLLEALGLPGGHAEGLFYPDTYRFVRGDSDADILRRAHAMLQERLQKLWGERADGLPYENPYQALIVASLIEKETGREADRSHISQVFSLRLKKRMRLQTDPAVIYGLGSRFDGNLTRRHLREDTPYNTYVRFGLPPTPIALVGEESIFAALHPAAGEYLYFVARGDGSSQFSKSLAEHNAAVRRYQLR